MGLFARLLGREDAPAPVPEKADPVAALAELRDQLRELREAAVDDQATRRMIERRLEDLQYELIGQKVGEDEPKESRERLRRRAHRYFEEDPVIGQAVNLMTWYVFGRGVPRPKVPVDEGESTLKSRDQELRERADGLLERFWTAPENQAVLTSLAAQEQKSADLILDGEIFLVLFDGGRDDVPLVLGEIDSDEITDNIITSRRNRRMVLFYERRFRELTYDFQTLQWRSGEERVEYYQHWRNEPDPELDKDVIPPRHKIAKGRIYHLALNRTSRKKRGVSEVKRVLDWAKGFNQWMESRLALAQAIAKVAQRIRVDGGPAEAMKVISQIAKGDTLALGRVPLGGPEQGQAKVGAQVHTPAVSFEPVSFETGAGSAAVDRKAFLGQIAAGMNWPIYYLGDEGAQSLANMAALELPTLKQVEARQELVRQMFLDLAIEALRRAGITGVTPEQEMPDILKREVVQVVGALHELVDALDPSRQNVELSRYVLGRALVSLGETRVADVVKRIFPQGYAPPPPPAVAGAGSNGQGSSEEVRRALERRSPYRGAQTADSARERVAEPRRGQPDEQGRVR